jgi:acetolactate synthase-1/2/3 large subunit
MALSGGKIVVRALEDEGVPFAFGIPGTHNIELYDALAGSRGVRPVLVTDEQSASFMADGVWRASGRMACANVVPGAGLTHALSGIAEAFLDQVPMLVLGCGVRQDTGRAFQLHDVDQAAIVAPVVKGTFRPRSGEDLYGEIRSACALARRAPPGPVFVEVPADLYLATHAVTLHRAPPQAVAPAEPDPALIDRVVDGLRAARAPLLYAGAGVAGAADQLRRLAELLEAPVATTIQGKGVFPEGHELFLWPGFGETAPRFVRDVVSERDLTLAIGCRFAEVGTGSYGLTPPGRLVHVDVDPDVLGRNYPADLAIASDAGAFLAAVLDRLSTQGRPRDEELRARLRAGHAGVWADWVRSTGGPGVTPAHLLSTAQRLLGPDTIFTADSGNGTFLAMECLRLPGPGRLLAPVDYSCMGYAVPAAIGARLARPDVPVLALAGDGAFLMTGLELLTAAREGAAIIVLLLRDGELAQIAQFQATATNRKVASEVHGYRAAALAEGMGVSFLTLGADEDVEPALVEAHRIAASGSPVLVEVAIDYSSRTHFTRGVVSANLHRLPLGQQARFIARALVRRVTG